MIYETIEQLQIKKEKMREHRPLTKDERKVKTQIEERKLFRRLINEGFEIPDGCCCLCCRQWVDEVNELKRKVGGQDE